YDHIVGVEVGEVAKEQFVNVHRLQGCQASQSLFLGIRGMTEQEREPCRVDGIIDPRRGSA
ncbi:MAG TPA: hypothetical protein VNL16_17720, partial [Chloroflexota bacterium]|nr:hypothetical protein [Chloroflexota bacterium]